MHRVEDRSWVREFYDSAVKWWGDSWYEGENLRPRFAQVERFVGTAPKTLLELGAGTGETAAFLAAAGYTVTAVDISAVNHELLQRIAAHYPGVTAIRGDFLTAAIPGKFDAVCLFEAFGMGTDPDQRNLLRRIATEWLVPDGIVIMDVYHPFGPIRQAGSSRSLERLENVAGSVDMTERSFYDAVLGRWIDEWASVGGIEPPRTQSIRCYTPADLLLLLERTGFRIIHAEFAGRAFEPIPTRISTWSPMHEFENNYAFTVILSTMGSVVP
ncbi:class I SAM-dependent methyltransferase [bacterium]|nr:class I SAM-dependent methyltransferase [candidate division CSSED10-310 bacterium]